MSREPTGMHPMTSSERGRRLSKLRERMVHNLENYLWEKLYKGYGAHTWPNGESYSPDSNSAPHNGRRPAA